MTNEELYEIWAPPDARWSSWARPVLFAQMPGRLAMPTEPWPTSLDAGWAVEPTDGAAYVIDLPGDQSVEWGLALARRGYRPVPLYNATTGVRVVVPVQSLMDMALAITPQLMELSLEDDAPPAFLLDSNRMRGQGKPGDFDNRWMTFPQDFPSARFLLSHRIQQVVLVQNHSGQPLTDLAHVLLRWQQEGLTLARMDINKPLSAESFTVTRPSRFRSIWQRALAILKLRRNSAGGFGSVVPQPGSSSGIG